MIVDEEGLVNKRGLPLECRGSGSGNGNGFEQGESAGVVWVTDGSNLQRLGGTQGTGVGSYYFQTMGTILKVVDLWWNGYQIGTRVGR